MTGQSFLDGHVILHAGDCRDVLKTLADNSVDSVVTDPPYALVSITKRYGKSNLEQSSDKDLTKVNASAFRRLARGFMGCLWDNGAVAFESDLWVEVLRVLKPGGYIVAFSGTRTYHRMACAIEDAGFITHPMLCWIFGSGFPKAHSVSKQLDKSAGAEREIIGLKTDPRYLSPRRNSPNHMDRERGVEGGHGENSIAAQITAPATAAARQWDGWFYGTQSLKPALEPIYMGQKPFSEKTGAANVLKWRTGALNIGACRIASGPDHVANCDRNNVSGIWREHGSIDGIKTFASSDGRWPANLAHDGSEEVLACFPETGAASAGMRGLQNSGRHGGLADLGSNIKDGTNSVRGVDDSGGSAARFFYAAKADADDRLGSRHPTVKPLDLIQWLVRLITPPGGTTLDLFAGTGTTGEAAVREGFKAILIEREVEYQADIARRMSLVMDGKETRKHAGIKARGKESDAGPLFGGGSEPVRHPRKTGQIRVGKDGPFGNEAAE